jgi:fumarate hydratase class II
MNTIYDLTLEEAALKLGAVSAAEFDRIADPRKMTQPYVAVN